MVCVCGKRTTGETPHWANLAGKVGSSGKNVKIMEEEQRYVIKFFSDEGMTVVQIVARLR
jgi:hypothetical protein